MKKIFCRRNKEEYKNKKDKKSDHQKPFYRWLFLIIVINLFCYYFSNHWYQLMLIQGNSMSPAYHNRQFVLLNRYNREFTYGDVIAFWCQELDAVLVKRIVACSGDKVVIDKGILYVNEEVSLVYSDKIRFEYTGILEQTVELGAGQYFVIGDNIAESKDSRYKIVGYVSETDILGKVIPTVAVMAIE